MFKITVCLLTFNSERLLHDVIPPLLKIADEFVVVDALLKKSDVVVRRMLFDDQVEGITHGGVCLRLRKSPGVRKDQVLALWTGASVRTGDFRSLSALFQTRSQLKKSPIPAC